MEKNGLDEQYREIFLSPIRKCSEYRPAFGRGRSTGLCYTEFQELYGSDFFYSWLGLDDQRVYAAHKAAGGLTSVYRQIGIGSERLFRAVIGDTLELSEEQMGWRYEYDKSARKKGIHTLDAKIRFQDISQTKKETFEMWLDTTKDVISMNSNEDFHADGVVFEVRQGYKSADSKRQNADLRFGVRAYQARLLPVFAIMSSQVSEPVVNRYRGDGMLILTGVFSDDPTISTFAFFDQIVGYDLAGFFKRNSHVFKNEIREIANKLLTA